MESSIQVHFSVPVIAVSIKPSIVQVQTWPCALDLDFGLQWLCPMQMRCRLQRNSCLFCGERKLFMWYRKLFFLLAARLVAQLDVCSTGDHEDAGMIPASSSIIFRRDWSWNIIYSHSLTSADSRRAVVSFHLGVVGCCEGVGYLKSLGLPVDIGLSWARPVNLVAGMGRGGMILLSPTFWKKSGGTLFLAFRGAWRVVCGAWFQIFSRYRVPLTPPTVFGRSFWNFTWAFRMAWRYACGFFRILK